MALSSDIISQFVKSTKSSNKPTTPTTFYGTVKKSDGVDCVILNDSDQYTPVYSTTMLTEGDVVCVTIENHKAVVGGNMTYPSATKYYAETYTNDAVNGVFTTLDAKYITADQIDAKYITAETITTNYLTADQIDAKYITAETITTNYLTADEIDAKYITAETITTNYLTADEIDAKYITAETITTNYLTANDIKTNYLTSNFSNLDYTNINTANIWKLYTQSGIIQDLTSEDGHFTNVLTGVKIKGDTIIANTLCTDRLVVKGTDGNYYDLSFDFNDPDNPTVDGEPLGVDAESLIDGSILVANSVTANKIRVSDLVAFGATIGGFTITDDAIHTNAKSSIDNALQGIYMDNSGQFAVGDAHNYLRYYKCDENSYNLAVMANKILLGGSRYTSEADISNIRYNETYWKAKADDGFIQFTSLYDETAGSYIIRIPIGKSLEVAADGSVSYTLTAKIRTSLDHDSDIRFGIWNANVSSDGGVFGKGSESNGLSTTAGEWAILSWTVTPTDTTADYKYLLISQSYSFKTNGETLDVEWISLSDSEGELIAQIPSYDTVVSGQNFESLESETGRNTSGISDLTGTVGRFKTRIETLEGAIVSLVTDDDSGTESIQTPEGWTFSLTGVVGNVATANSTANTAADDIDNLSKDFIGMDDRLTSLERITVDADEDDHPRIGLTETDSTYKSYLTNMKLSFLKGSNTLLSIGKSDDDDTTVLEIDEVRADTIKQGGFAWSVRANGNYALMWEDD